MKVERRRRITGSPIASDLQDGQNWNWVDVDNDGDSDPTFTIDCTNINEQFPDCKVSCGNDPANSCGLDPDFMLNSAAIYQSPYLAFNILVSVAGLAIVLV